MPKSPTKRSTPKLSEVARHVVIPQGVVTTGWAAVEGKSSTLGIRFRWWQIPIGKIILAKRSDGKYASTIGGTGLSIPRQVGKTFLVGMIVFALCLLRPGLTVVWSAHRVRTAEETFKKLQGLTRRKRISPFVSRVVLASGEEAIEFVNGSRIMFGARAAGFGRGFDEVDVVVYDEAQILPDAALDDMIPAMNQCRQPEGALMLFMGTPPKPTDPGEVFTRMRTEALSGEDHDTGWVEFGSDNGFDPTPAPAALLDSDWRQVAKANPSFPEDTPPEAILRMRKKLGAESFLREGLGIWDEKSLTDPVVPIEDWRALAIPVEEVPQGKPDYYSLTISPERIAFIGVGIRGTLGDYVDLAKDGERVDDQRLVVDWFAERRKAGQITVAIDSRDPAAALVNQLRAHRIKVNVTSQQDSARACVGLIADIEGKRLTHFDQPILLAALKIARKKPIGKAGLWEWDLEDPTSEIAALRAITLVRFGLTFKKARTGNGRSSSNRTAVTI